MIRFNYYDADIKNPRPLGVVSLEQFFEAIRNPKPHIQQIFEKIKQAEIEGNQGLKAELKTQLFSFTPCVLIRDRRAYECIERFNGLMVLDFDHLTPDHALALKSFLFNEYEFIIAVWLSASKCGVRALVNIPVVKSTDEFKSYFQGIARFELAQYQGFDYAPQNCVLPLFLSHDPDIMTRETESIWDRTYIEPEPPPKIQYKTEPRQDRIEKIIRKSIDKIHDNGHPQLRATAFVLGGYMSAGYISYNESIQLINYLIDHNAYLSQKPHVYKKTAKTMIEKGSLKPLFL